MKKSGLLSLLIFLCLNLSAQKVYFIYLQSEKDQPFFVRMNDRIYNSSASGFLILSKLKDGLYSFVIGLPGKNIPDLNFEMKVDGKDQGYLLKDFGDQGWGLFNWQTLAVKMPQARNATAAIVNTEPKEVSSFTKLLAKAADDTTLMQKPVLTNDVSVAKETVVEKENIEKVNIREVNTIEPGIIDSSRTAVSQAVTKTPNDSAWNKLSEPKESVVTSPVNPVILNDDPQLKKDTAVTITKPDTGYTKTQETVNKNNEELKKSGPSENFITNYRSSVQLKSESSTTEGITMVFNDTWENGSVDVITISIPVKGEDKQVEKAVQQQPEFVEMIPMDSVRKKIEAGKGLRKNDCPGIADEEDFFRLRRRMAGESKDENMIDEARKIFRAKCFTTAQIKNLGSLFLTDGGKYRFFDESYLYVSDPEKFPSLITELKDPYYINRFKAMIQ